MHPPTAGAKRHASVSLHRQLDGAAAVAAARLLGVTEVYAMGGAGAIGALAYGVADLGL